MVICPKCKEPVNELVKRYDLINTKTGLGQAVELEKSVCEMCIEEIFIDAQERVKSEENR